MTPSRKTTWLCRKGALRPLGVSPRLVGASAAELESAINRAFFQAGQMWTRTMTSCYRNPGLLRRDTKDAQHRVSESRAKEWGGGRRGVKQLPS